MKLHWLWTGVFLFLFSGAGVRAGDRDTAMALLSGAEKPQKDGHYDVAADLCQRAINADNTCGEAFFQLGLCQAKLNRPREAIQSFRKAEELALAANDDALARRAKQDAEKLCPGIFALAQADQRLVQRLLPLAEEALEAGYLDTALDVFTMVLAVTPDHQRAREGAKEARKQLDERGNPIQAKLADAMLQEIWYLVGTAKRDEARKMAQDLGERYPGTSAGKEARELVRNDFGPPRKEDSVALAKQLKSRTRSKPPSTTFMPPEKGGATAAISPPPEKVASSKATATTTTPARRCIVDLDALEAAAADEAKKTAKDGLAAAFADALQKGKDFYSKAAPGTEGNQANLAKAVEQFVRAEALFGRLEQEKLVDQDLEKQLQEVSMLKYGCLKMVVLAQQ